MGKKFLLSFTLLSSVALGLLSYYGNKPQNSCEYDSHCEISRNGNGDIKPVSARVKALLSLLDKEIVEAGLKYGVDPRAVAGAIAAENSLNVQIDDSIQDFLANAGITNVMGRSFSYGVGQIYPETANKVEALAAEIENRPRRTKKQVADALTKPRESISYAAAILKDAQEKYKSAGMDISQDIGALTTLYNLGDIERRLTTRSASDPVRPNFFGVFVEENIRVIEDAIGWSPLRGKYEPAFAVAKVTLPDLNWFQEPQKIFRAPSSCKNNQLSGVSGVTSVSHKYNKYPIGEVQGLFSVHRSTLDCELRRWSLIQSQEGEVGWLKNDTIKKAALKKLRRRVSSSRGSCSETRSRCLAKIKAATKLTPSSTEPIRLGGLPRRASEAADMDSHYQWCTEKNSAPPVRVASHPSLDKGYKAYQLSQNRLIKEQDESDIKKIALATNKWLNREKMKTRGTNGGLGSRLSQSLLEYVESQLAEIFTPANKLKANVIWQKSTFDEKKFKEIQSFFDDGSITLNEYVDAVQERVVSDQRGDFYREQKTDSKTAAKASHRQDIFSEFQKHCANFIEPYQFRVLMNFSNTYMGSSLKENFYQEVQEGVVNLCLLSSKFNGKRQTLASGGERVFRVSRDDRVPRIRLSANQFAKTTLTDFRIRQLIENNLNDQTQLGKIIGSRKSFGGVCNFNEQETLQELKKVSRLPCVSKILVPQEDFFDTFSGLGPRQLDKVVFDSLRIDDFTVVVEGCTSALDQVVPGTH